MRGAVLAGTVCLILAACSSGGASRGGDGAITERGEVSVFDLRPGDCLDPGDALSDEVEKVVAVPCGEPHTHEVVGLVEWEDGDTYPGEQELAAFSEAACLDEFRDFVGIDFADSTLFQTYVFPTIGSWNDDGDRTTVCMAVSTGDPLTESVEGSMR